MVNSAARATCWDGYVPLCCLSTQFYYINSADDKSVYRQQGLPGEMSRTVHNVIPEGVLHQKVKYFVAKVIRHSVSCWVSCQSIGKNQSFVLLVQKLPGELMIKCERYTHGQSPDAHLFTYCVKISWIEVRKVVSVLTEGKAEFSNFKVNRII